MIKKYLILSTWLLGIGIFIFLVLPAVRNLPIIKESMDQSSKYGIKNESLYYSSTPECGEAGFHFRHLRKFKIDTLDVNISNENNRH